MGGEERGKQAQPSSVKAQEGSELYWILIGVVQIDLNQLRQV